MITLVETVGSVSANTYATLAEANLYAEARVNSGVWIDDADDELRKSALVQAARLLDRSFRWNGVAASETQARMFPRVGLLTATGFALSSLINPTELKEAQIEWAIRLVIDSSILDDNDLKKLGLRKVKAGSVEIEAQPTSSTQSFTLESYEAEIRRLGSDFYYLSSFIPDAVRILIPPSWYMEGSIIGDESIKMFGGSVY